jgi:3-hydroxyisobutyrate dehydrogenase
MARRVVDSGFPLTLWARRPDSLQRFEDTAARLVATPAELGGASDVVEICVVADADVEDVLLRSDGVLAGMSPGGVVVIHSTIHPETCRRLALRCARQQVAFVDAPVSGGGVAATQRSLVVMVGGDDVDVARCRPVFETFGDPIVHLGPVGSGQMAKLLNNLVFTAQIAVGLETFLFADTLGIDRSAVAQVLASGSGGSRVAEILSGLDFDLTFLREAASLLEKDVGIALDVARVQGATLPANLLALATEALATLMPPNSEDHQ